MHEANLYDRAEAIERLAGDSALFGEMAALFVAENARYRDDLAAAFASADAAALSRHAHTMKSLFATFSCETGRALAQRLEEIAAGGDLIAAAPLVTAVLAAAEDLGAALVTDGAAT